MSANTFGTIFRVTTFGESHGRGLGAVIDGCPAGVPFDWELLRKNLARRRPGQSDVTTARAEQDAVQVWSGVFEDKTLGTPMALTVENHDANSASYTSKNLADRRGHATDLWREKFGHADERGSGRASGRETVSRVMAGSVAQMALHSWIPALKICAHVSQIGPIQLNLGESCSVEQVDAFKTRMPSAQHDAEASTLLLKAKEEGDSYGGKIRLDVRGVPRGLGQPVFHKIKADFAAAFLSIGASSSFHLGPEIDFSENGKKFHSKESVYGGIRGGITSGEDLVFEIGFKPPSTIADMAKAGRHDPCILPRAVPVIEAMACLVLADQWLWHLLDRSISEPR